MTLGFSVAELLPYGRTGTRLTMGLSRIDEAGWLWPEFDAQVRANVFDRHPEAVQIGPEAEAAGREVAVLVGVQGGLAEAARATWEDLCILQSNGPDGSYRLTGAAVAFPTDWRVEDKMGLPLAAIHAPIHGYAEQLAVGVDRFMAGLTQGDIFARANWFIVAGRDWRYMPQDDPAALFAHVTAENAGETLFVRCERQTLRRLPETGAILFTIGVAVEPLGNLVPALVRRLADALAAQSDGEQGRRGAPAYLPALAAFAAHLP